MVGGYGGRVSDTLSEYWIYDTTIIIFAEEEVG